MPSSWQDREELHMDDPVFTSALTYQDPRTALEWLERAFGFEVTMAIEGPTEAPEMCHYEMSCQGRGRLMLGARLNDWVSSPTGVGGKNTQTVHVQLRGGPDALDTHCEQARAAGATIDAEPEDQFYGDRSYRAVDLEGHRWTFSVTVREVSRAEAEELLGQPISSTRWA
jgi:uncharacterized glyoxalase superfamily protein PhnB